MTGFLATSRRDEPKGGLKYGNIFDSKVSSALHTLFMNIIGIDIDEGVVNRLFVLRTMTKNGNNRA